MEKGNMKNFAVFEFHLKYLTLGRTQPSSTALQVRVSFVAFGAFALKFTKEVDTPRTGGARVVSALINVIRTLGEKIQKLVKHTENSSDL